MYFPKQWAALWTIIQFHTHTGQRMAPHVSVPGTVSILRPLLYYIISYVNAPCLWNIKMSMMGTILEIKQKVTWSSAHQ